MAIKRLTFRTEVVLGRKPSSLLIIAITSSEPIFLNGEQGCELEREKECQLIPKCISPQGLFQRENK